MVELKFQLDHLMTIYNLDKLFNFPVSHELDTFEEYLSVILHNTMSVPQFRFVSFLLRFRLYIFSKTTHRNDVPFSGAS